MKVRSCRNFVKVFDYFCPMRVIQDLSLCSFNQPLVTMGTYDGVHLGHQEIIKNLVKQAHATNKESVLFTFHPHPRMVLQPDNHAVKLIDTIDEKLAKLALLGLDTVVLFPFTLEFSRLSAEEFVQQILVDALGISAIHIGYDHHFGKNREGSFPQLVAFGQKYNFDVVETPAFELNGTAISSTKIRKALQEGAIEKAQLFLGTPFVLTGTVIHGNKLGRTIGFPTANLAIDQSEKIIPAIGVYAVSVTLDNKHYKGVMNVGKKPTVMQTEAISVEVFIFDFSADIYEKQLSVAVLKHLRGEQRFGSIDLLKEQLKKDEEMGRMLLADLPD